MENHTYQITFKTNAGNMVQTIVAPTIDAAAGRVKRLLKGETVEFYSGIDLVVIYSRNVAGFVVSPIS